MRRIDPIIGQIYHAECPTYDAFCEWAEPMGINDPTKLKMRDYQMSRFSRSDPEGVRDLVDRVLNMAMEDNRELANSVDHLLYFHALQSSIVPPPETILDHIRSYLGVNTPGFSISQQRCVSFHMVLQIVEQIFSNNNRINNVLVVGADILYYEEYRNMDAVAMEGDGAVACIISRSGKGTKVKSTKILTQGQYYGQKMPKNNKEESHYRATSLLAMRRLILETVDEANIKIEQIKMIIPHNGNVHYWKQLLYSLRISDCIIFNENISSVGHIYCSDMLINLNQVRKQKKINQGEFAIMAAVAFGRSFGCSVIETQ